MTGLNRTVSSLANNRHQNDLYKSDNEFGSVPIVVNFRTGAKFILARKSVGSSGGAATLQ